MTGRQALKELERVRRATGLSQAKFADGIGVPTVTYEKWLRLRAVGARTHLDDLCRRALLFHAKEAARSNGLSIDFRWLSRGAEIRLFAADGGVCGRFGMDWPRPQAGPLREIAKRAMCELGYLQLLDMLSQEKVHEPA